MTPGNAADLAGLSMLAGFEAVVEPRGLALEVEYFDTADLRLTAAGSRCGIGEVAMSPNGD